TSGWGASMRARRRASGPSKVSSRTVVAASGRRPSPKTTVGAAVTGAASRTASEDFTAHEEVDDRSADPQEDRVEDRLVAREDGQERDDHEEQEAVLLEHRPPLPGLARAHQREEDLRAVERWHRHEVEQ